MNKAKSSITKIGREAKIEGKLDFKGPAVVEGTVSGTIRSESLLTISENANVESNIKAKEAIISGNFKGDMVATGEVRIKPTGKFIGKLIQKKGASLVIERGGVLKGKSFISRKVLE